MDLNSKVFRELTHGVLLALGFQLVGKTPLKGEEFMLYMSPHFLPRTIASESYFIHELNGEFRWYRNQVEWFPLVEIIDVMALHKIFSDQPLTKELCFGEKKEKRK